MSLRDARKISAKGDQTTAMVTAGTERRNRQRQSLRDTHRRELLALSRDKFHVDARQDGLLPAEHTDPAVIVDAMLLTADITHSLRDALGTLSNTAIPDDEIEVFADRLVEGGALRAVLNVLEGAASREEPSSGRQLAELCIKFVGAVGSTASLEALWHDGTFHDPRLLTAMYREVDVSPVFVCDILGRIWQREGCCRHAMCLESTAALFECLCSARSEVTVACGLARRLAHFDYRQDGAVSLDVLNRVLTSLSRAVSHYTEEERNDQKAKVAVCVTWFGMLDDWAEEQWELVRAAIQPQLLLLMLDSTSSDVVVTCLDLLTHFRADSEDMAPQLLPRLMKGMGSYRSILRASLRLLAAAPGLASHMLADDEGSQLLSQVVLPNLFGTDQAMRALVLKLCIAICGAGGAAAVARWDLDLERLEHDASLGDAADLQLVDDLRSHLVDLSEQDSCPW